MWERQAEVDQFFHNTTTEVVADYEGEEELDNKQRSILGRLIQVGGTGIMLLLFVPNPLWGRMVFIAVGGIVLLVGTFLIKSAKSLEKPAVA